MWMSATLPWRKRLLVYSSPENMKSMCFFSHSAGRRERYLAKKKKNKLLGFLNTNFIYFPVLLNADLMVPKSTSYHAHLTH